MYLVKPTTIICIWKAVFERVKVISPPSFHLNLWPKGINILCCYNNIRKKTLHTLCHSHIWQVEAAGRQALKISLYSIIWYIKACMYAKIYFCCRAILLFSLPPELNPLFLLLTWRTKGETEQATPNRHMLAKLKDFLRDVLYTVFLLRDKYTVIKIRSKQGNAF